MPDRATARLILGYVSVQRVANGLSTRTCRCVQCLTLTVPTRGPWFPKAWSPASFVGNRITVPECKACNNRMGRIEDELDFLILGTSDPSPEMADLRQRVSNSMDD